jgi:phosphohistidine phosphatase
MKLLGLMRHAKSDWDDLSLRDFDRGLNNRGRKGAALMGVHITALGLPWERVLASPAERVCRTLDASGLGLPVTFLDQAYMADSTTLLALMREHGGDNSALLLAAHNPGLQELALDLVPPEHEDALFEEVMAKFPTAAFAVFELDIDDWAQSAPGCGRLTHFVRPRDLDPDLGPERRA